MQMTDEAAKRALQALKRFRIGAALICAIPLAFAALTLALEGGGGDSAVFTIMSICMMLLIVWVCHCAERFLKTMRSEP